MSDIAIRVENLSKRYHIGRTKERHDTLRDALVAAVRAPLDRLRPGARPADDDDDTIWALKDVSFEIKRGEVVGVIGRNGAGKSTLLKILSRITEPTSGRAEIHGRVGSLLEVGTGFHPELTGRENVYLSGAILGMRRAEIDRKFDEIVDFSGVEKFIDTPFKRYSSGMRVRLGFAVAAHLDPEILLVDEVLAVGDAAFQKKCLGKMGEVAGAGRTVVFVSHSMAAIQSLCTRALWLDSGVLQTSGATQEVVSRYLGHVTNQKTDMLANRQDRQGDGRLRLVSFRVYRDAEDKVLICGDLANIEIGYEAKVGVELENIHLSVGVKTLLEEGVLYLSNDLVGDELSGLPNKGKVVCHLERLPLVAGSYSVNLYCKLNGILSDWIVDAARLEVEEGDFFNTGRKVSASHSKILVQHSWKVVEHETTELS